MTTLRLPQMFLTFSFLALLVMNFDRYLATSYPLFHQTWVTKRKLLSLVAILISFEVTLMTVSVNNSIISFHVYALIFLIFLTPPMVFVNYKLFVVVRKSRRNRGTSSEIKKKTFWLRTVSSSLLVVACVSILSIPQYVYVGLRMQSSATSTNLN